MGLWQQLQLQEAVQESPSGNLEMTNRRNEITRTFKSSHSGALQVALKYMNLLFKNGKKISYKTRMRLLKTSKL